MQRSNFKYVNWWKQELLAKTTFNTFDTTLMTFFYFWLEISTGSIISDWCVWKSRGLANFVCVKICPFFQRFLRDIFAWLNRWHGTTESNWIKWRSPKNTGKKVLVFKLRYSVFLGEILVLLMNSFLPVDSILYLFVKSATLSSRI